jgi:hypothetical protein
MNADQSIRDWIDSVCRRSTRTTGWPFVFEPAHEKSHRHCLVSASGSRPAWQTTVNNGTEAVGTLRLEYPSGRQRDEHYLQACAQAELTAELIERVLTERASNELLRVRNNPSVVRPASGSVSVTLEQPPRERQPVA